MTHDPWKDTAVHRFVRAHPWAFAVVYYTFYMRAWLKEYAFPIIYTAVVFSIGYWSGTL